MPQQVKNECDVFEQTLKNTLNCLCINNHSQSKKKKKCKTIEYFIKQSIERNNNK